MKKLCVWAVAALLMAACTPKAEKTTDSGLLQSNFQMEVDGKKQNILSCKSIARHEVKLNLSQLVQSAKRLLKPVGSFSLVHRSYRFTDISRILEDSGFSLKRVRFVYFSKEKNSNLVLIEAWKGKKCKLEIEPPLYLEESGY